MSIEAMKQALGALDEAANVLTSRMFADSATALREAIEQAEKPVAWQQELGNILCLIHRDGGDYISEHGWRKAIDDATLKVANLNSYMSVPQYEHTREWVELTDEDIVAVMHGSVEGERMLPHQFARAIEAELKAKNERLS
jgi:hypothetical protein